MHHSFFIQGCRFFFLYLPHRANLGMAALPRQAALKLFAKTRNFILHLEIQSPWLTMGLAGTGLGAFYKHQSDSDPQHATIIPDKLNVVPAVKKGVEGNEGGQIDPEVMRIGPGSIVVKLVCHTEQSFLMFIKDFKEGKIKARLETEFGNIGCKEPLTVTIPKWDDEVQKNLNAIRYLLLAHTIKTFVIETVNSVLKIDL